MAQSINEMNMKKSQPGPSQTTNFSQTCINNENSNSSLAEFVKNDIGMVNLNFSPDLYPNSSSQSALKTNFQVNYELPLVKENSENFSINSQNFAKPFQVDPILNEINVFVILLFGNKSNLNFTLDKIYFH